ncbi:MAG TPA: prepilin-type N-terminal cleavage/methylation domain-containing protein [Spirochaetota bacterium]|nr:prepilin-type N-terminal cleavage/methylation domain-containing protein [Spirochaetota bacterium]
MRPERVRAFTLLELLVVLVILSLIFFIVTPNFFSSINPQKTKQFMMNLQGTLEYLSEKAILQSKVYLFTFDLDEREYRFMVSEEQNPTGETKDRYLAPRSFPSHLEVESIKTVPGGLVTEGELTVPFTPNGMLFSFEITLEDWVLTGDSVSGRIRAVKRTGEQGF